MKYFRLLFSALFLFFIFTTQSFSQIIEPGKWSFDTKKLSDTEVELQLTIKLDAGWHIYSQNSDPKGPMPIVFTFEKSKNYELVGKVQEPKPKEEYDELFKATIRYFSNKVTFRQKIKLLSSENFTVKGSFSYQLCDDQKCIPFDDEFSFSIKGREKEITAVDSSEISTVDTAAVVDVVQKDTAKTDTLQASETAKETEKEGDSSLWMFFWIAFGGGLLAIVMPCVFPMIPMTVSFFMHSAKSKAKARAEALFFSLSIIGIYTIIGLLITILLGPAFVNWLSTHWIPNLFFFIIFIVFAISFFGAFEITLPSWLVNKSDAQADKGGFVGAFFMAFTLVLVSFSCTAPIVGTILVEAARGSILRPVIGMLGFSLAIAIPFGFFAFFPQKLNSLPKSGGWLNSVKVCLGFLELALGLKFLMVADQTYHWGLLPRHIYIAIWIIIFLLMGIYLMGKIKFRHDSDVKYIGIPRLFFIIVTFSFVAYLIPGMFGSPLEMLAGYLPPQSSHNFNIPDIVKREVKNVTFNAGGKAETKAACEDPKYEDFLHLPYQLEGYFDLDQALRCAKAQNKPLFIDFTGHGCVNCREMEATVWGNPKVMERLQRDYVVVALYVDDKKALPEDEVYVSDYDNKKKKTIGAKNADIQIKYFEANSQPNYILLDNNGDYKKIKDDVLAPSRGHNLDIDAFVKFLDQGVAEFKKRHSK